LSGWRSVAIAIDRFGAARPLPGFEVFSQDPLPNTPPAAPKPFRRTLGGRHPRYSWRAVSSMAATAQRQGMSDRRPRRGLLLCPLQCERQRPSRAFTIP